MKKLLLIALLGATINSLWGAARPEQEMAEFLVVYPTTGISYSLTVGERGPGTLAERAINAINSAIRSKLETGVMSPSESELHKFWVQAQASNDQQLKTWLANTIRLEYLAPKLSAAERYSKYIKPALIKNGFPEDKLP